MKSKKSRTGYTITEILAEQAADPEYQRRTRKVDAEREKRSKELKAAEDPILADLRLAGYDVTSVSFLGTVYDSYPEALPILMKHLERGGYPNIIMDQMARRMGVRYAEVYWDRLRALYDKYDVPADKNSVTQGLADALGRSASKKHFDDLVELLRDDSRDGVRVLLIEPIIRIGRERGWEVVESLADDPVVGKEASYRLHQRELRRKAKARHEARGR